MICDIARAYPSVGLEEALLGERGQLDHRNLPDGAAAADEDKAGNCLKAPATGWGDDCLILLRRSYL